MPIARSATSSPAAPVGLRSAADARPAEGRGELAAIPTWAGLAGILLAGLIVRLLFIGANGFSADVGTFEAWSLTLADHPMREFYAKAGFADYPPGYFFILAAIGHAYRAFVHDDPGYGVLKAMVKLPAILCDLVIASLLFGFVRARVALPWAYATAAAFAFDPAAIFISAYWGQVDSVAAAFALGGLILMANAGLRPVPSSRAQIVAAWVLLAYSILIKPPALVLAPLFLAFCFTTDLRSERVRRLGATALGIVAGFALAYVASLAFNPGLDPVGQFAWLYARYRYASGVYPYNSVNAFNLYVTGAQHFWQSDTVVLPNWHIAGHVVGLPQYLWGVLLLAAAVLLVTTRFAQRRDGTAIVEAAAILSLGYFVLSTRMHERYDFNADTLAIALLWFRRRYAVAAVLLSLTLFANLVYSLDYLAVMTNHTVGADPSDLLPWLSRPAAIANVATFFYLGYAYLGSDATAPVLATGGAARGVPLLAAFGRGTARVRAWFAPDQGLAAMTRLDWALAAGFGASSFLLDYVSYWLPSEKIFDEIYYARAGEEYLRHVEIFEFTHPPLTKLVITGSMMLFGGLHGLGDTAYGWRFGNLVVGSLMVVVMYAFAKRLLGSTLFAAVAAGLLVFDGFHFVQSRIATPEITVAFFTLTTLYAFYRYWIAAQIRVAPLVDRRTFATEAIAIAVALAIDAAVDAVALPGQSIAAHVVLFLYLGCGAYAAVRLFLPRVGRAREMTSYADGTRALGGALLLPDGGYVPFEKERERVSAGLATTVASGGLVLDDGPAKLTYGADGSLAYETPAGTARYTPDGTLVAGGARIDGRRDANLWFAVLAVSAGCLAASKWNGLFDFFVVWLVALAVVSQRWWSPALRVFGGAARPLPAGWGNPFGFSFDVLVTGMLFVAGSIYLIAYVPFFGLGHNLTDVVSLQQQMFIYHDQTVAHATHPYSSRWWQWPILEIPISYYYHDFRTGAAALSGSACCVAEVIAIPNPLSWWLGVVSVPFMGWLAWRERNKGYALLFVAYFVQWLPWILSPRISFEYHFLPNLAIILMADAVLLQRIWRYRPNLAAATRWTWNRIGVGVFLAATLAAFIFWYPVVAGSHITYDAWSARMLTWLEHSNWINPHPGK